jgi:Protein of unknown function (DUF3800)
VFLYDLGMENKYIYIDESGDTGYTKKSTRYFILTAVMTDDLFVLRRIAKNVHRGKRDKKKANILHAYSEIDYVKNKLIKNLADTNIQCFVIKIKKNNKVILDIYLYTLKKMAEYLKYCNVTEIVIARKDTRKYYNKSIIDMFKGYGINILFSDMFSEKALQIADFYSWCIFTHLEHHNSNYFSRLSHQITFI